jgi:hypothetical protein
MLQFSSGIIAGTFVISPDWTVKRCIDGKIAIKNFALNSRNYPMDIVKIELHQEIKDENKSLYTN